MKVHVDGDVIVYRAGYAAEHNIYHVHWVEDGTEHIRSFDGAKSHKAFIAEKGWKGTEYWVVNETQVEPEQAALFNVRSILKSIADKLQVSLDEEVQVYLSGPTNYRNGVATLAPYKGNRDPTKKPVHAAAIKELMRSRYNASTTDGIEADDAMATAHMALYVQDPMSSCIATIDKDLDTVPGLHYNFVADTTYDVSPDQARFFFWQQMLTGDTVDNIPGIKGMGAKTAAKVLAGLEDADEHTLYDVVLAQYQKAYGENADAALLEMGNLLYIRQEEGKWWKVPERTT